MKARSPANMSSPVRIGYVTAVLFINQRCPDTWNFPGALVVSLLYHVRWFLLKTTPDILAQYSFATLLMLGSTLAKKVALEKSRKTSLSNLFSFWKLR